MSITCRQPRRRPAPSCALDALSPLDGRYAAKLAPLRATVLRGRADARARAHRMRVAAGARRGVLRLPRLAGCPRCARSWLESPRAPIRRRPTWPRSRPIEARTNHDVKAVEYLDPLRAQGSRSGRRAAGTGAFRLHLGGHQQPGVRAHVEERARRRAAADARRHRRAARRARPPARGGRMLARTHGQAATPTTVGKEFANVAARLRAAAGWNRARRRSSAR